MSEESDKRDAATRKYWALSYETPVTELSGTRLLLLFQHLQQYGVRSAYQASLTLFSGEVLVITREQIRERAKQVTEELDRRLAPIPPT